MRGQHAVNRPGLATVLGHKPAQLARNPGGGQHHQRQAQQPGVLCAAHFQGAPEGPAKQQQHGKAQAHHDAEGPEHGGDARHGAVHGFLNHLGRGLAHVHHVFLQQQAKAQVGLVLLEHGFGGSIVTVFAQRFQRHHGVDAVFDADAVGGLDVVDAGNFFGDRACADQAHDPGNVHFPIVFLLGLVDASNQRQPGGGGFGFPHGLHGRQFGLLGFTHGVATFVAQHDDRTHAGQAERGGHAEAAFGKFQVTPAQHVPRRHRQHKHRACHVARRHRVHKLGLCIGVEHHGPEVGHFHAHGHVAELGTHGVLHPAVGNQDPKRAQVGAHGHEDGHQQMLRFGQAIPAKKEQADHGGLKEERHQPLDGQRRTEDVTHIVRVVGPVGAELKLQRDARGHAQCKVDAEQLAPKAGHVLPDDVARHHIDALHDDQQPHHAQRERHEQKVVHGGGCKLQPRKIDKLVTDHGFCFQQKGCQPTARAGPVDRPEPRHADP